VRAADFVLENLFSREDGKPCFRYTLVGRDEVHNANLLGAAYLCRVGRVSGDRKYLEPALEAARFSVTRQHEDGSWAYGEAQTQQWIDNFHTGFNLVALRRIREFAGTAEFDPAVRKGFDFFKAHFFRDDGAPKYYSDAVYPIDIHSAAQSIITLAEFSDFGTDNVALAHKVLGWTLGNMRSPKGYFYFQKRRRSTVRTPFMRWSQAWMLLALATLLKTREPAP
jgi:mannose/cellobiose epimerase-like protein (N-acyl-D-glucosamine 2-epimerase family)